MNNIATKNLLTDFFSIIKKAFSHLLLYYTPFFVSSANLRCFPLFDSPFCYLLLDCLPAYFYHWLVYVIFGGFEKKSSQRHLLVTWRNEKYYSHPESQSGKQRLRVTIIMNKKCDMESGSTRLYEHWRGGITTVRQSARLTGLHFILQLFLYRPINPVWQAHLYL